MNAEHWIDGRKVGENCRFLPAMAAQLSLGIWLPGWAGLAPWETAGTVFASIRVWQYDDPGDVRGILTESVPDKFTAEGEPLDRYPGSRRRDSGRNPEIPPITPLRIRSQDNGGSAGK